MKALFIDTKNNSVSVVDPQGLDDYYELIGCRCVDIVERTVGTPRSHMRFNIICDDEGTFTEDPLISAIDNLGRVMLVGSLIITGGVDEDGELIGLTEKELKKLAKCVQILPTRLHPEGRIMLTQCEY
ncbi:MAG: hypothetical protein IKH75_14220 [Ruminococcus sp.]|nr:hypothetical protein [Ruminococcus sp.]